jgi:hypothetical protein
MHRVHVSQHRPVEQSKAIDAYFTVDAVAEACFATTIRVLREEGIKLDNTHWAEPCAGGGAFLRLMPEGRRVGYDLKPADDGRLGIVQCDYRDRILDPAYSWLLATNAPFSEKGRKSVLAGRHHRIA